MKKINLKTTTFLKSKKTLFLQLGIMLSLVLFISSCNNLKKKTDANNTDSSLVDENATVQDSSAVMGNDSTDMEMSEEVTPVDFSTVLTKPLFQNGSANLFTKWVSENLTYPENAKKNKIEGRVVLQFTIGVDGTISDIKVLKGINDELNEAAIAVVKSSPKWTPGKDKDGIVPVIYNFPVIFQLKK